MDVNKIYNEECLVTMGKMPDELIDATVTSPPYDNLRAYKDDVGLQWNFEVFKPIADELYRVTKQNGVVVWVVGDACIKGSETGSSFKQALYFKDIGFNLHDTMIYKKQSRFPEKNRYQQLFEYMFIFSKGKPKTHNIKKNIKNIKKPITEITNYRQKNGDLIPRILKRGTYHDKGNIWEYAVGGNKLNHPAVFPEKLAEDHITSWSNKGDIVLDPFAGSGTTCKMAKKLGRKYIGIDISQEYLDIATERLNNTHFQDTL